MFTFTTNEFIYLQAGFSTISFLAAFESIGVNQALVKMSNKQGKRSKITFSIPSISLTYF